MKTAIVEIRESHEECIYTQLAFLKDAGHHVTLVLHPTLARQISDYIHLADAVVYFDFEKVSSIEKIVLQFRLFTMLKKFDVIVLNTAQSYSVLRNVSMLLRLVKTKCIGVLHDTKKLHSSFTQRIISKKIKKYFVLNDALLSSDKVSGAVSVQSFYPIFFPPYDPVPVYKQDQIWIGIPGRIDFERRDFDFLLDAVSRISTLNRVKFIILGKVDCNAPSGKLLYNKLEKSGKSRYFKLFESFIENRNFHAYLDACDYIMPLLRTKKAYLDTKISGTFNLAFAHKKTMLCHTFFKDIQDLRENSLFYDETTFPKLMANIEDGGLKHPTSYSNPKWEFRFQQRRYLDFINE